MPTAYSYVRFSSKRQEAGDSIRRQVEMTKAWAERNSVPLDTSLRVDKGVSAFRGRNADLGSLGEFLKLVERGRVQAGDYLVVESLDRISRDEVQAAARLILNLLHAGVRVVQLQPVEIVYDKQSDTMPLIIMIVELSRANSESKVKSERVGAARARERARRRNGEAVGGNLPAWVRKAGDRLILIPERAAVVRRIFELSANGYGIPSIAAKLTEEKVPTFGSSGRWSRGYIAKVLTDRKAMGEHQPTCAGRPEGGPITDYYPAAVTPEEYHAAQAGLTSRKICGSRTGPQMINLFARLMYNAREPGDTYVVSPRHSKTGGKLVRTFHVLLNLGSVNGPARCWSFPYLPFEDAILSLLREVRPSDIFDTPGTPDDSAVLAGQFAALEARISAVEAELMECDEGTGGLPGESVPSLARVLRALEAEKREVGKRLAEARQRAVTPLGEAWGEASSLSAALASAPDQRDARLRLRGVLRRIIERIDVVITGQKQTRLAGVQVRFVQSPAVRNYLIVYRPQNTTPRAKERRPERWWARSLPDAGPLDLRRPDHAAALVERLEALDLASITG